MGVTRGAQKRLNNATSTFFWTVQLFPKEPQVRTCWRHTCVLPQKPSYLVAPLCVIALSDVPAEEVEIFESGDHGF